MATTNKGLNQPALNSTNWDVPLNANFGYIDAALGGVTSISVTGVGVTPQTLTLTQYQSLLLSFTGTLSANVTYQVPSGVGGQWVVYNGTTGAFTLTIRTAAAGAGVSVPSGVRRIVYSDGTGVYTAEAGFSGASGQIAYGDGASITGSAGLTYDGTKVVVTSTTSTTNAATEALRLNSQSSGTPAAGIGAAMTFAAETAAGVTKDGMQLSAVATDVSTGTEDFDLVLKLMASGAAAAEVFRVSSTGTVTASGSVRSNAFVDATGGNAATVNGVTIALASKAQAEAGTDNATLMTPLRVKQSIAGTSADSVGSYVFAQVNANVEYGATVAGSSLQTASAVWYLQVGGGGGTVQADLGGALSGTWRCMGKQSGGKTSPGAATIHFATLWLRIA